METKKSRIALYSRVSTNKQTNANQIHRLVEYANQKGADFDLYLRTKKRAIEVGDIKPMHICLDVFNHHYIRLTAKGGHPPFADTKNFISLKDKWSATDMDFLEKLNK